MNNIKKIIKQFITFGLFLSIISVPNLAKGSNPIFTDVDEKHIYKEAIKYLKDKKIVQGYNDGSFGWNKAINRAEFVKILLKIANVEAKGKNCYQDVQEQWFAPYVCTAKEKQIVQGYGDGNFHPEQNVNFVEASKIIVLVKKLPIQEKSNSEWYYKYVNALEQKKAIPASISVFNSPLTRGQMAEMIWRVDEYIENKVSGNYQHISAISQYWNKAEKDSMFSVLNSMPNEYLFDLPGVNKMTVIYNYIETNNLSISPEEKEPEIDDKTQLEIKALAGIYTNQVGLKYESAVNPNSIQFRTFQNILTLVKPLIGYKRVNYIDKPIGFYKIFPKIDASSFEVLIGTGGEYINEYSHWIKLNLLKDKNGIYIFDNSILEMTKILDLKDGIFDEIISFEDILDDGQNIIIYTTIDKVYKQTIKHSHTPHDIELIGQLEPLDQIDRATLEIKYEDETQLKAYLIDKNAVYTFDNKGNLIIAKVDRTTLVSRRSPS